VDLDARPAQAQSGKDVVVSKSEILRSRGSRVYVAAGNYTKQDVCDRFINQAQRAGILLVSEECYQQIGWRRKEVVRGSGLDQKGLMTE